MVQKDNQLKNSKITKHKLPLFVVVIILSFIIVALMAFGLSKLFYNKGIIKEKVSNETQSVEKKFNSFDVQRLKNKKYEEYQYSLLSYVDNYLVAKDYDNAQRLLDKINAEIPADRLASGTYRRWAELSSATGDMGKYREYTTKLIKKLKQEGREQEATYFEKQLKENQ